MATVDSVLRVACLQTVVGAMFWLGVGDADVEVEVGVAVLGVAASADERGASCNIAKKFRPSE